MRMPDRLPLRRALVIATAGTLLFGGTALAGKQLFAGLQGDGTGVTSYGWTVTPAGRNVDLTDTTWWADRPYGQALSPDGKTLLVSSGGPSTESIKVVDTATGAVRQTIPYVAPEAVNVGVVWSKDGKHAYVTAGGNNKVRTYALDGAKLTEGTSIKVPNYPMGLAISGDGKTLFTPENRGDKLAMIDVAAGATSREIPLGGCTEQGSQISYPASGPQCQPYGVTLSADGSTAYVSDWGEDSVIAIDLNTGATVAKIAVGTHPNALATNPIAARHEVAVANGDSDTISLISTATNAVSRTINLAPYANAPVGTQPNALAFSPDGKTLYTANAGDNDVDVVRLAGGVVGMIPTAWYPTAVDLSADGRTLLIANAKGLGDGPNPNYKQGVFGPPNQYAPAMMHGTLQIVKVPDSDQLEKYTDQVRRNDGFGEGDEGPNDGAVIPHRVGLQSPIKHVIYVVKENRTYDQVFGNLGKGNGDPSLTLFGDESAPNIRALARQFVVLDNFYAASEVSADGWSWSTEATANTYDQKTFPENYSDVNRGRGYDYEGGNYASAAGRDPKDSYIWDRLADNGVSFRNYGFFTQFGTVPPNVLATPTEPKLASTTDPSYEGYNLAFADSPLSPLVTPAKPSRISEWQHEFAGYVANPSTFPTVEFVRLPNDHTAGTRVGAPTPRAYVADNDYALGLLVQTVSHSPFWKDTAIFVVEDDAQDGPDHVDAHRTEALVISPYTQTGRVDSTFYSTVSMLHTIELIAGVKPMTQFDAAATPMAKSFSRHPNFRPYEAKIPAYPMTTLNSASAPMAEQMAHLSDTVADQLPDQVMNEAIWKSVKGEDSMMPGTGD